MLFVGDDWAEDHHDVEVVDEDGRRFPVRRLPEGPGGIAALHALIARFVPQDWSELDPAKAAARVKIGIETDRGPWVAALIAAGYEVFAINPMSVSRYRIDTRPREPRATPVTRMCSPRSCAWTAPITGRSRCTRH